MPGSPPISTTPPSTMPPPSTRSSSSWPVGVRCTSVASMSARVVTSAVLASEAKRFLARAVDSATDSMSVFQALQCGHLPSHLGLVPPHSLQVYWVLSLAMCRGQYSRELPGAQHQSTRPIILPIPLNRPSVPARPDASALSTLPPEAQALSPAARAYQLQLKRIEKLQSQL